MTERTSMIAAAEAMRAEAMKVVAHESAAELRRRGFQATAEVMELHLRRINNIDAATVVDDLMHSPPPSLAEVQAFEAEAQRQFLNTRRKESGEYAEYITSRAWLIWCAGARWAGKE